MPYYVPVEILTYLDESKKQQSDPVHELSKDIRRYLHNFTPCIKQNFNLHWYL